jgi:hypothetical protein
MKTKNIAIVIMALLMLSNAAALATVKAPAWPYLPGDPVQLTAVDGVTSYFIITLSGVPVGYDVHNQAYPGWCINPGKYMPRGEPHDVMLYSSISPPVLGSVNWVAINYILNHKQGAIQDVQDAIWHYTVGFAPSDADALAMIAAADAHPGYDPMTGAVLAVLCIPLDVLGHDPVQETLIELPPPPSGSGLSPGYWKHNVKVYCGGPGHYSGDPHETDGSMESYELWIQTHIGGQGSFTLEWANTQFQNNAYKSMWLTIANWFNAAAGLSPYVED